jgi:ribosomal protein L17
LVSIIATGYSIYTNIEKRKIEDQNRQYVEKLLEAEKELNEIKEKESLVKRRELEKTLDELKVESTKRNDPQKDQVFEEKIERADVILKELDDISKMKGQSNGFYIRLYSFKPDVSTKRRISSALSKAGYSVKVYPDWETKPDFFANTPTVLYYDRSTKDEANNIAKQLAKNFRIKFKVTQGAGFGISEKEKKNTFIIHYLE